MKELVVFDLDGTLAPSKSTLDAQMAQLLDRLLRIVRVAVISGGAWSQFETQLLRSLPQGAALRNLSILPTCGTKFFQYDGEWEQLYSEDFEPSERNRILDAFDKALALAGYHVERVWGDIIEDRGSQITFSGLGQQAPLEEKDKWDPDFAKRKRIKDFLETLIPDFSIQMGGATSIDVTRMGVDKAYGIRKLSEILQINIDDMLFVGDALFPGGNDYPATETGIETIAVKGPDDTKKIIEEFLDGQNAH